MVCKIDAVDVMRSVAFTVRAVFFEFLFVGDVINVCKFLDHKSLADMFLNAWYLQSSFVGSVYPTYVTLIMNSVCLRYYARMSVYLTLVYSVMEYTNLPSALF